MFKWRSGRKVHRLQVTFLFDLLRPSFDINNRDGSDNSSYGLEAEAKAAAAAVAAVGVTAVTAVAPWR